jgi:hypothetical protein
MACSGTALLYFYFLQLFRQPSFLKFLCHLNDWILELFDSTRPWAMDILLWDVLYIFTTRIMWFLPLQQACTNLRGFHITDPLTSRPSFHDPRSVVLLQLIQCPASPSQLGYEKIASGNPICWRQYHLPPDLAHKNVSKCTPKYYKWNTGKHGTSASSTQYFLFISGMCRRFH